MSTWYYTSGRERMGPVDWDKLSALAAAGALKPGDLVWNASLPQWTPASTITELSFPAPLAARRVISAATASTAAPATIPMATTAATPRATAAPVAARTSAEVGYYADQGLPPRAAQTLKGYAAPTGDVGVWPVDESELSQWAEACKQRRLIRSAQGMYRGLCALSIIVAVIFGCTFLTIVSSSRGRWSGALMVVVMGFFVGTAVLYGLAAKAARRNQVWGPIAVTALMGLGLAAQVVGLFISIAAGGSDVGATVATNFISILVGLAFLWVSARAIPAIKKFRACPAWCQELLIVGKY